MDLSALKKRVGKTAAKLDALDEEGALAAPVDVEYMFQHGVVEASGPTDEKRKGTLIDGSVSTGHWVVKAPVWVTGDVTCTKLELTSSMVVEGTLTADEVIGRFEPNTLTVLGKVTLGTAAMKTQFIMQFLGGGTIDTLADDEGGAEELVELMREAGSKLKVKTLD